MQIACLPSESTTFPQEGLTGVVAGWGELTYNGTDPDSLQNVRIDIFGSSSCDASGYSSYSIDYTRIFCAGKIKLLSWNRIYLW